VILVEPFAVKDPAWPYDSGELHLHTVQILKAKDPVRKRFEIIGDSSEAAAPSYTLSGEVLAWQAGNRATRLVIGLGAGRESADIRFWLTDVKGTRLLDRRETIRAQYVGNALAGSVGELAEPFASKIADRLENVRLDR
jgi:hypothetical protein